MKRRNFVWYSLLFATGCTTGVNSTNSDQIAITTPKNLKFAVTDVTGIEDLQRDYGVFRTTLEEILGIKIELFPVENPTAAAPALLSKEVDIVFAGPSEYLILNARAKAIPIIAIERPNYHSIIVIRTDSKIKLLSQLKGKTIAMRKIGSTSGHLAPTKLLIDAGLDPKTDFKIVMLDDKGVQALKKGEVDAWATASDRYKNILESEGLLEKDFSVLFKGSLLPGDVFVASNQLASSFIADMQSRMIKHQDKLIQSLLTAKANQKYKGGKFILANDADYNMIREVYQKIGQGNFL
ncbi:phosphonate ABC transporter substrate-binding protein [Nostoc sp. 'Peltigera membranacea cyanobiont' 210A]|uniref:phosphate/phosphite/phosphonate ABC transporter substrate-binding protein n=1 Tax=Nostoc sp. 'Peltigera membranacea cyanobiont' 210A TaxID=2014529 RepID=UPI000B95BF52|nr:phosphate/phosphite/phosphonate ABC transporter substrate-binding protein [Nostoc sp. 'Peltigera membranacea cyanobiont' 210A]OYD89561.1 phosphonate ABC transporter substrate-binding protein [Nostoc sp. 'Peltigera membranacea cyanobiont' 210A]